MKELKIELSKEYVIRDFCLSYYFSYRIGEWKYMLIKNRKYYKGSIWCNTLLNVIVNTCKENNIYVVKVKGIFPSPNRDSVILQDITNRVLPLCYNIEIVSDSAFKSIKHRGGACIEFNMFRRYIECTITRADRESKCRYILTIDPCDLDDFNDVINIEYRANRKYKI